MAHSSSFSNDSVGVLVDDWQEGMTMPLQNSHCMTNLCKLGELQQTMFFGALASAKMAFFFRVRKMFGLCGPHKSRCEVMAQKQLACCLELMALTIQSWQAQAWSDQACLDAMLHP